MMDQVRDARMEEAARQCAISLANGERIVDPIAEAELRGYARGIEDAAKVAETQRTKDTVTAQGYRERSESGEREFMMCVTTASMIINAIRALSKPESK